MKDARRSVIDHCLTYPNVFEDQPFSDPNWIVVRHKGGQKRGFAWIYERGGALWLNVKCEPALTGMWQGAFEGIQPGYHMNKEHWISVRLDGSVPEDIVRTLIGESWRLTGAKARRTKEDSDGSL